MTVPMEGTRFPRCQWWVPGYEISEVDALVDRIERTLAGTVIWSAETVSAADVRQATFRTSWRQGYDEEAVDKALDLYAEQLDSAAQ